MEKKQEPEEQKKIQAAIPLNSLPLSANRPCTLDTKLSVLSLTKAVELFETANRPGQLSQPKEKASVIARLIHDSLTGENVPEPVFLCDAMQYETAMPTDKRTMTPPQEAFLLVYMEKDSDRKQAWTQIGHTVLNGHSPCQIRRFHAHDTVGDWLYAVKQSAFILTDDYYGVCFALIFNKSFAFIESVNDPAVNPVKELLLSLQSEERIVYTEDDFRKKEYLFRMPIRYHRVNRLLSERKKECLDWLEKQLSAIEKEKP